jgi:hypothetical protein
VIFGVPQGHLQLALARGEHQNVGLRGGDQHRKVLGFGALVRIVPFSLAVAVNGKDFDIFQHGFGA